MMMDIASFWHQGGTSDWSTALRRYWSFVKPSNLDLEREMDRLQLATIAAMNEKQWHAFLVDKFFKWKYTAPNRYASTTRQLARAVEEHGLTHLAGIRKNLLRFDLDDIRLGLQIASGIGGLGIAGASGLLAILYPSFFGTVDQFVVKALQEIPGLPESSRIAGVRPTSLKLRDGVLLISLMRRKACELNIRFSTKSWTPRKIDMVLWTLGR